MDVETTVQGGVVEPEFARMTAHVVQRDLRGLLHHVAELTGEGEAGFAVGSGRERGRLDEQDIAAGTGHGESGRDAGSGCALRDLVVHFRSSEPVRQVVARDRDRSRRSRRHLRGDLAHQSAEFAFE